MSMAKSSAAPAHTPTPWFYGESKGGKMYVYAQDKRPVFAVNVSATGRPAAEIEATKKFIVTACNAHQALYEALSALECSDCEHSLGLHADKYGCQFDRGDGFRWGSEVLEALGPCSCKGGSPSEIKAIAALADAAQGEK